MWGVGGQSLLLLLRLIPEYRQQTTDGKSAAFTFSPPVPDVEPWTPRDKGNQRRDDEVPAGAGQVFPPSPLPAHLPPPTPPPRGAAEYTCPPLTHRDGSMRS